MKNLNKTVFVSTLLASMSLVGCKSQPTTFMEWSCRNTAAEISCQDEACTVAPMDGFTPMELTINSEGGMSLCAYSGCWAGDASVKSTAGQYLTLTGLKLPWSGLDGAPANISVTINKDTNIATLLTDDYAHPMICKRV